jgi:hypothetical protein
LNICLDFDLLPRTTGNVGNMFALEEVVHYQEERNCSDGC